MNEDSMKSRFGGLRPILISLGLCGIAFAAQADPADGERFYKQKCAVCHSVQPGQTLVGPSLANIVDRKAGSVESFRYSPSLKKSEIVWDQEAIATFIESPRKLVPGTNMAFPGERDPAKRIAIVEYLATLQ